MIKGADMTNEKKCDKCNGTGKVEENDDLLEMIVFGFPLGIGIFTDEEECPECNGTGKRKQ